MCSGGTTVKCYHHPHHYHHHHQHHNNNNNKIKIDTAILLKTLACYSFGSFFRFDLNHNSSFKLSSLLYVQANRYSFPGIYYNILYHLLTRDINDSVDSSFNKNIQTSVYVKQTNMNDHVVCIIRLNMETEHIYKHEMQY